MLTDRGINKVFLSIIIHSYLLSLGQLLSVRYRAQQTVHDTLLLFIVACVSFISPPLSFYLYPSVSSYHLIGIISFTAEATIVCCRNVGIQMRYQLIRSFALQYLLNFALILPFVFYLFGGLCYEVEGNLLCLNFVVFPPVISSGQQRIHQIDISACLVSADQRIKYQLFSYIFSSHSSEVSFIRE